MRESIVNAYDVMYSLRIDNDEEITLLDKIIIPAAEDAILGILRRSYENLVEEYGFVPAAVKNATIMLCGTLLKNREADAAQEVKTNPAFRLLLVKFIKLTKE